MLKACAFSCIFEVQLRELTCEDGVLNSHARDVVGLLPSPRRTAEIYEKVQRLVHPRKVCVHQGVYEQGEQGVGVQRFL